MHSRFFSTLLLTALLLPGLRAEELTTSSIAFSDPTKPGTLKIRIARGDLRVTGADVGEITVKSKSQTVDSKPRKDGLRVLGASSSYSLAEKDNVVTLENLSGSWVGSHADFAITVPRATLISLENSGGGDVACTEIAGDLDIKTRNGEVHLDRFGGAACVESTNGVINVDIPALQPGKAYSFTSMNGEVRVRVPAEAKANVRLRTQNGAILTDFDEKALITKLENLPRKTTPRAVRVIGKRTDSTRTVSDAEMNAEVREAVQEAIQAGAEAAREAASVARDAMRIAAEELRTHNGGRNSDAPLPPLPPMTGGKIISGTLNGGGPEIQIATMNGDVTLRKLDDKK
jgi:hypothetical protein